MLVGFVDTLVNPNIHCGDARIYPGDVISEILLSLTQHVKNPILIRDRALENAHPTFDASSPIFDCGTYWLGNCCVHVLDLRPRHINIFA